MTILIFLEHFVYSCHSFSGAYCPRYFMSAQHIDPEQALQIHSDLKSKLSIGIHWGTFPMGSTEVRMVS